MKKVLWIIIVAVVLTGCSKELNSAKPRTEGQEIKEQREGLDREILSATLKIAETLDDLYVNRDVAYDDLDMDSEEYKLLKNFEYDSFKNKDEEYSKQEDYMLTEALSAINNYMLNGTETEEGTTRERGDDMMDNIHNIERNADGDGFSY